MSVTQRVSPDNAIPFGAFRVTPFRPDAMKRRLSTTPSGLTRLMKPAPSLADGLPTMLLTK